MAFACGARTGVLTMRMAPLPNTGSKDGTNVYAAAYVSRAVAVLRRTASGALQQPADRSACINRDASMGCARARAIGAATAVAIDPDGRAVYVSSFDAGLTVFARR